MGKEENSGMPDPISIDFSRRVREALKRREADRQPPWTIAGLARAIGVDSGQISNLNRYVNIGAAPNGYTHWRPDWMLRTAQVLEIPADFDLGRWDPSAAGGAARTGATPARDGPVKLRIGLASEYPDLFETAFEIYAACADAGARGHGGSFRIDLDKPGSREKVHDKFLVHCSDYNIIMLDDPWIPEFEPRLLDLRSLPLEEFRDTGPLEELFFRPLFETCEYPVGSGKLCGLPILGDVDFLCHDATAARGGRLADLLGGPVIDPDRLRDELLGEGRARGRDEPDGAPSFRIRTLEDEDLVENFWLLLRGYGLEDAYRPGPDGEIEIPAELARRASDWMYDLDPKWNRRLRGGELMEDLIAGGGPTMTFAWPNTFLPWVRNDPSIAARVGLHPFARQALLGAHILAIPAGSGCRREQIEAARAILTLTTDPRMQFILADLGSIPVLDGLPHLLELRKRPFWKENYAKMVEALRTSHPRPRSPRWREFSRRLAEQLRRRRFADVPGVMRFV